MWQQFKEYEQAILTLGVGLFSLLLRAYRYQIRNRRIIVENIIYCLLVCLVIVPWLKVMFSLSDTTTYIITYFMCQSAKTVIEHFVEVTRSRFNI